VDFFSENSESVIILPHSAYLTNRQSIIFDVSETSRFRKLGGSQSNVTYIYIYISNVDMRKWCIQSCLICLDRLKFLRSDYVPLRELSQFRS